MQATRRGVLKVGGLGLGGAVGAAALPWGSTLAASSVPVAEKVPAPFEVDFVRPPVLRPWKSARDADGVWTDHFRIAERPHSAAILPGTRTTLWGYDGHTPGPTLNIRQGRRANDVTPTGHYKSYHYPNFQPARTLWYHDHGVHHTATNAYAGLYAQYHLHDRAETELLPQGEFDVPLTVTDALLAPDGALAYDDNSQSGLWGNVILVNGVPWPVMRVKRRVYRFRLLNASVSRSYRFVLDTGDAVTMVATDGGLMPRSREVGEWRHASAERYEMLIDFQVLDRNGRPPFDYERGRKDVVYVGEGETVRLLMRFGPHRGRYMVHCHNLPHEDHDMMGQFAVGWKPGQPDPNDPILAAPAMLEP